MRPTAMRPKTRAHCTAPSASTTPTSSTPSSGSAFSNGARPPTMVLTLATSTQLASPLNQRWPSTSIVMGTRRAFTLRMPVQT